MTRFLMTLALCLAIAAPAGADEKRPMTVQDVLDLQAPSAIAVSPDGRYLAYALGLRSFDANTNSSQVRVFDLHKRKGVRFAGAGGDHEGAPAWSPDGSLLAFTSDKTGTGQIWVAAVAGQEDARQVTDLATGAGAPRWLPEGDGLVFTSRVYSGCKGNRGCNEERLQAEKDDPVKARVFRTLMYRHWDHWRDERIAHLHVTTLDGKTIRDLMPEDSWGVTGGWDLSTDGGAAIFTTKNPKDEALHTNNDLHRVEVMDPLDGRAGTVVSLTEANPAYDAYPALSPDGERVLHLAHRRPGFESDRTWLTLRSAGIPTGTPRTLAKDVDRWIQELGWFPSGKEAWFTAMDEGRYVLYRVKVNEEGAEARRVVDGAAYSSVVLGPRGKRFYFVRQTLSQPPEIWTVKAGGKGLERLTFHNKPVEDRVAFATVEDFWWTGAEGDRIHGFLLFPPGTSKEKKNRFLLLIHGGPQGMWTDSFHPRWNAQLFAAPGYVTLLPNPRGSSGYGQEFTDEISRDWGGRCYEDLMKGVDALIETGWIDEERLCAGGGSFGGYMANWILGKTDRFRCLFSHAGVYDLVSMYGSTEELWFPDWEYGGPPWDAPGDYKEFSPSEFAANFETPMFVIHGANDFRVPLNQAMQLFTALQRRGVPSRFLYFPDETHFVTKPKNTKLWFDEIHGWLEAWLGDSEGE